VRPALLPLLLLLHLAVVRVGMMLRARHLRAAAALPAALPAPAAHLREHNQAAAQDNNH